MKKILKTIFVILIVCIFFVQTTFWYTLNKKDEKILKIFFLKIDKIYKKDPNKIKDFYILLKKIRPKYKKNKVKFYFLTWELEKYLEKKVSYRKQNFLTSEANLVEPNKIKKIPNEQDQEIEKKTFPQRKKNLKWRKKITKKILKNNFEENQKKLNKKILKITIKNWVLVKYIKKEKKYIPKNTPKNLSPKIEKTFLIVKILDNNFLLIKYYKKIKIFEITWIENYSCNKEKINIFLKKKLEKKIIFLDNIKKKNDNFLKADFFINWEKLEKLLLKEKICKK